MGISILGLADITYRKHVRSMIGQIVGKKKPRNYVDASNVPIVLALFAISEAVKADVYISGAAKVNVTGDNYFHEADLIVAGKSSDNIINFKSDVDLILIGKKGDFTIAAYNISDIGYTTDRTITDIKITDNGFDVTYSKISHTTNPNGTDLYIYDNDDAIGSFFLPNFGLIVNIKLLEHEGGTGETVEGYPIVFVPSEIENYFMVTYPDGSTKYWTEDGEIEAPEIITETSIYNNDDGIEWTLTVSKYADGKKVYYNSSEDGAWKQETHTINADGSWTEHRTDSNGTDVYMVKTLEDNGDKPITATGSVFIPNFGLLDNIQAEFGDFPLTGTAETSEGYPVMFIEGDTDDFFIVSHTDGSKESYTFDNGDTVDSVVLSGDSKGFVIEGSHMYYTMGDLHGFDTNKGADDPSYVDLIKSDKFTSTYQIIETTQVDEYTQEQEHTFIMKGPETITGQVNGFLNIAPSLGNVATTFGSAFTDTMLVESGATVASFVSLAETNSNLYDLGFNYSDGFALMLGAELLATTSNTNLTDATNLSEWPVEEPNSAFEYMDSATFATFDTFVGAKSKSDTYKLDGVISDIADFAIFTPAYQYDFLGGYSYISLHWENNAGEILEVVEQTNEALTLTTITLSLQDDDGLVYGGQADQVDSTDMSVTFVFEGISSGDVTSKDVTKVVASDASFKVFEDILSTVDDYYVGDRVVNITYVPVIDKEKLSYGDLAGSFTMDQTLFTTTDFGADMVYNDGLVYTVENQQGVYGSLSLLSVGSYTDSYHSVDYYDFSGIGFNKSKGWQYILDNTDPDTIALSPGEIGYDLFTVNVSDGIHTSSIEIQIFVEGVNIFYYTNSDDNITTIEGADWVSALAGDDAISLIADGVWNKGYSAKNIETHQQINLQGFNRFSDIIDGGADSDTLNLTTGNDAFFIDDVYSDHHSSLTLTSTTQGIDSTARIVNLEVINAGAGNDIVDLTSTNFALTEAVVINGEAGNDVLWGSNGNDTINGGEGDDTIFGGTGSDTLTGGAGSDIFQFTATAGSDVITDFDVNNDSIELYYREGEDLTDIYIVDGILKWRTGDAVEYYGDNTNGFITQNYVSIDLSTSISDTDLAILNISLLGLYKEGLDSKAQLFKEMLSVFDIPEPSDADIKFSFSPSIDTSLLAMGDLTGALTIGPALHLETPLGANVQYANGITYYIEAQQGVYGSFGFSVPLGYEFSMYDISTGKTDLRTLIEPIIEDITTKYTSDYATMYLASGFNWPTWYYVLDNNDIDTINATADSTHVDSFTIKATNGVDVVSQQIDVNIFGDIGPPFDNNTILGQLQPWLTEEEDYLYIDNRSASVSLDDLNNFDPFITFVEIV